MPLGETLLKKGIITQDQLNQALAEQKNSPGEKIGEIIVRLGFASKSDVDSSL